MVMWPVHLKWIWCIMFGWRRTFIIGNEQKQMWFFLISYILQGLQLTPWNKCFYSLLFWEKTAIEMQLFLHCHSQWHCTLFYLHIFLPFTHFFFLLLTQNTCCHANEENAQASRAKQENLRRKCQWQCADSPLGCTCWRKRRSHGERWACWIHWSADGPVQLDMRSYPDHWWQAAGWYQRSTW